MRHTASSSAKGGASSPYVQGLAPSSKSIQQLMDDQEAAYIRVTNPEPETRGVAPLRHRSHIVRDRYFAAAAAVSTSPKGYPPKNNYTKQTRPGKGAATRSDAPLSSPCRTPPRPTSAVTNASTHAALAKKRITSFEHRRLNHFYNRQVFSLGGNNMPSDQRLEMAPSLPSASVPYHVRDNDRGSGSEDEVDKDNFDTAEDEDGFDERILDAHPQTDDLYDQCFEADWTASQIEKVVKDGVECRRIYAAIKPHYRVLVCLFRLHATVAPTPTDPCFRLTAKLKLLEGLNVVVADPTRHGINDQPMPRHGLLPFVVHIAQVYLKREELVIMLKRLAREGLDTSSALHHLLHDNILPYANIQDGQHFRRLFHNHPDIQSVHFKYATAVAKVFQMHATLATSDPLLGSGQGNPPPDVRFLKLAGFLSILSSLHQMDAKFDDVKATHVFVSCLPVWPDDLAVVAQELTLSTFQEALTKVLISIFRIHYVYTGTVRQRILSARWRCATATTMFVLDGPTRNGANVIRMS
ncbi:hypothetical protein, variant [Aphanomyces astaci]|uniref:Uncharacterized protein n=1 Tax=Aphanomyces astaci TaxID=112090 RepID=W4GVN0_APHAT|nr:hypothetical protein, variant [Aphanomyces astaci]ETV82978.1 hypothetical protein, variant [Aphanomyces astaci]|eukprot:XP_009827649.1 hypothetical protein, variant [Aphanomyces astaci]